MRNEIYIFMIVVCGLIPLSSAACQISSGTVQSSISPAAISIANGEVGQVMLTVQNPMLLTPGTVYVNDQEVGTVSMARSATIPLSISAPGWGSGTGTESKPLDLTVSGEGECWDNGLSVSVSHYPSQAETAAEEAKLARQQTSADTFVVIFVGIIVVAGTVNLLLRAKK